MQILVISSKEKYRSEVPNVIRLFAAGLEIFHLRKPRFSLKGMEDYLDQIPTKYHNRIVVHSFHELAKTYDLRGIHLTKRHKKTRFSTAWRCFLLKLKKPRLTISTSCHDLTKLDDYSSKYDYVMLSPVYDSISKTGRQAAYAYGTIKKTIKEIGRNNIYALGGVNASKIEDTELLGFGGVALLGSVWHSNKNPVDVYNESVDVMIGRKQSKIETSSAKIEV